MRKELTPSIARLFFLFTVILVPCEPALAGGFQILEQSGEGVGNAFAGATAGYGDGSEIAFNPAAMSWIEGSLVSHSSHLIISSAEFSNQGSRNINTGIPTSGSDGPNGGDTSYVPNVYAVSQVTDELHLGLGLNAPFGLKTDFDREWVGRYHAVKSELKTINITPAISYALDPDFSLGAGLNIMYVDAELSNMVDLGTIGVATLGPATAGGLGLLPQQADGFAKVDGDDWTAGFNLGAAWRYDEGSRIGLSWHSKVDVEIDGDADFDVPANAAVLTSTGLFTDTSASADVTLPDYANFGWIHSFTDEFSLLTEIQWTHWSRFDELRVDFDSTQPDAVTNEGWDNTWRLSIGGNYKVMEDLLLRTGFTYDQTPISDDEHRTPRIPGNDRKWLALGLTYDIDDSLSIGANYAHIFLSDAKSNVVNDTGDNLVGEWDAHVDLVNVHVGYTF